MKALSKILLLAIFLLATLFYNVRFSYLVLYYNFNNESFTELFCENKDKPELECNGQCTIAAASEDAAGGDVALTLERYQQEILLYLDVSISKPAPVALKARQNFFFYDTQYSYLFTPFFLHPPGELS